MSIIILIGILILFGLTFYGLYTFKKSDNREGKYDPELNLKSLGDLEDENDFKARVRRQLGQSQAPTIDFSSSEHLPSRAINYRRNIIVIASLILLSFIPNIYLNDINLFGVRLTDLNYIYIWILIFIITLYNFTMYLHYRNKFERSYGEYLFIDHAGDTFEEDYKDWIEADFLKLHSYQKTKAFDERFADKPEYSDYLLKEIATKKIRNKLIDELIKEQPLGRSFLILDKWVPNIAVFFISICCLLGLFIYAQEACSSAKSCRDPRSPGGPHPSMSSIQTSTNIQFPNDGNLNSDNFKSLCWMKSRYDKVLDEGRVLFGNSPVDAIREGTYLRALSDIKLNNIAFNNILSGDGITIIKKIQNDEGLSSYLTRVESNQRWVLIPSYSLKIWYETRDIIEQYNITKRRWYKSEIKRFTYDWYLMEEISFEVLAEEASNNEYWKKCSS